jgi:hypothetical protein
MSNTMSDRDIQSLLARELADTQSANTISDRDVQRLRKKRRNAVPKKLSATQSANTISNKDVEQLERMLNRNDGGIAKKTRCF